MTVNKTNKKEKKLKKLKKLKNNNIIYVIEAFVLTAAAVFLSVISGGALVNDLTGLICVIAASALFACVLFLTNPGVIFISGIASFAITFTINGNITGSFESLIYVIIGSIIYFGLRNAKNKKTRTQITVLITVVLVVFYFLMLALSFMMATGTFYSGMIALTSEIDRALNDGVESFISQYTALLAKSSGGTVSEETAQAAYLTEIYVKELVMNFKAIIPACFIIYSALIAYLSTSLFKSAYNIFIPMANPGRKKIKNKYWRVNISVVSAIIMIAALFFALLFSKKDNILPSIVLTNLIYILAPGFCLMGIYFTYDRIFKEKARIFPVMLIAAAIMFAFIFPSAIIFILYAAASVLMAVGLYAALIDSIKKVLDKAKKALLGDENDDDDDDYID
ncbi:MAG: hypothetical protein FWF92_05735 [Oscillospiraceae bacterium]|nr:hypothetical protein [Oscillospiraceae bacterium]